jgi:lipoprotein NlpD
MNPEPHVFVRRVRLRAAVLLSLACLFAGCTSTPTGRAPVEDRKPVAAPVAPPPSPVVPAPGATTATSTASDPGATKLLPGSENAGKLGYYTVKPGDTLIRVGLDNGQPWRDIARWNGIDNPNLIEIGQVLRVLPPTADASGVVAKPVAQSGRVETRPLDPKSVSAASAASATSAAAVATGTSAASAAGPTAGGAQPVAAASAASAPGTGATAARDPEDDLNWIWPAAGPVGTPFDDNKSKGLAITGKPGDPVVAAADGRVVYAGAGLRGYGNLIIVKHNATYLSAYAHNQTLLVKEDQVVRRGQKIAEMGSSDAERVQLHFEIRRQGKPIDPARLLPSR